MSDSFIFKGLTWEICSLVSMLFKSTLVNYIN